MKSSVGKNVGRPYLMPGRILGMLVTAAILMALLGFAINASPQEQELDGSADQRDLFDPSMPELIGGQVPERPIVRYQPPDLIAADVSATEIDVWYGETQDFGSPGTPQEWVNILGRVSGTSPFSLSYTLNGGASTPLSVGGQPDIGNDPEVQKRNPRLSMPGDFNVELAVADLLNGANSVELMLEDRLGISATKTITVNYSPSISWPQSYTADWSTAAGITEKSQVVDGLWSIVSDLATPTEIGYDRAIAIGDFEGWTDYEVIVPVTVNSVNIDPDIPGGGAGVGMIVRWKGHIPVDASQPQVGWRRLGALGWYRWALDGSEAVELRGHEGKYIQSNTDKVLQFGTTYNMKMSVQTTPSGAINDYYRFKVWPADQSEPAAWDTEGFGKTGEPVSGSLLLLVHNAEAGFGNVQIMPLDMISPTLTAAVDGVDGCSGSVTTIPDDEDSIWGYGDKVTIVPVADAGCEFNGWTGDFTGLGQNPDNRLAFNITQDISVTANFQIGTPKVLEVNKVGDGEVVISPQKATYDFGETVQLTAIAGENQAFVGWSGDVSANVNPLSIQMTRNKVITASFGARELVPPPLSDDFNQCELDTMLWSFVDPVDDGDYEIDGQRIMLTVPEGTEHNLWKTEDGRAIANRTVRLVQPAADADFQLVAKFESILDQFASNQLQGILIEQDEDTFLFFDFFSDATRNPTEDDNVIRAFAGYVNGDSAIGLGNADVSQSGASAMWLRVARTATQWSASYSFDGENWTEYANFTNALEVTSAGPFAGNASGNPAHTAIVDYFFNSAVPIIPEDALSGALSVNIEGTGSVALVPDKEAYVCNETIQLTATPGDAFVFGGWSGALSGSESSQSLSFDLGTVVNALFREEGTVPGEFTVDVKKDRQW